ncbi:hypothetical protein P106B_41 [Rhizobium phage vB_RglS_P106B]|uniref:Uncharacterized protein n=1 Tax=Rhizobium phage vB_RglS_P106B TaxID=1458697 RepID=W6E8L8_9CAUD|nr:hypothetical protein P106B_41 [Rhizobium phage vB_RglS_P106B]AHJ10724.1 hypothetical protein P106B_41 [Rhizobium phage vB_RglS_P106B]
MIDRLLGLIPNWMRMLGAGVLGALVAFGPIYLYGKSAGKTEAAAQAAKAALNRIQEMERHDAKFRTLPARDRCIIFMRDSGLPVSNCD